MDIAMVIKTRLERKRFFKHLCAPPQAQATLSIREVAKIFGMPENFK